MPAHLLAREGSVMIGDFHVTPSEQVSVDPPARRVRILARTQAAAIAVVTTLAGITVVFLPMIAPEDRLPVYLVMIGLVVVGGLIFAGFDFALARMQVRVVAGASELRRAAADRASELAQLNVELRRRDRQRSDLFATMSHELRTPLHAILGFSGALLDGLDGDLSEPQRADVLQIHEGGKGLLDIVNGVLELARLESGAVTLREEPVHLATVVDDVVSLLRPLAQEKYLILLSEVPPELPPVQADEERLRQILVNLVGNALKFTDRGGVTIRAYYDDRMVSLDVIDTGIGILPSAQELIFEPFRQADQADTRRHGGTGLGLAIARQTASLMHGRIWVESEPGSGSTFHLALPLAPRAFASPSDAEAPTEKADVLILSDRDASQVLTDACRSRGHQVMSLRTDDHQALASARPNVVGIDLLTLRAGAWRALADLRAQHTDRVPVGLFAVGEGVGRLVMSDTLDLLVTSTLETQLGERLEAAMAAGPGSTAGPVIVASADPVWRGRVAVLLARKRWRVVEVSSVERALAVVQERPAAALVIDLLLPSPGILPLLSALQSVEELRSMPVTLIAPVALSPGEQYLLHRATSDWLSAEAGPIDGLADAFQAHLERSRVALVQAGGW